MLALLRVRFSLVGDAICEIAPCPTKGLGIANAEVSALAPQVFSDPLANHPRLVLRQTQRKAWYRAARGGPATVEGKNPADR